MSPLKLKIKLISVYCLAAIVVGAALFLPAGTLNYWPAWVYTGVMFIPALFVGIYFYRNNPEFLIRRLQFKEKEKEQSLIIKLASSMFFLAFLVPGLDYRYGWSDVPAIWVISANIIVFCGYLFIFWVFKENSYASRIVEVMEGQKVISTGPYAVVRHPMYLGVMAMYLATPIALGSWWALIGFLPIPISIVFRLLNEEKVLLEKLPGYKEYCEKVKYHLIPFIW